MTDFRPRYITFDCYGTLIRFRMDEMTREIFADRIPEAQMADFRRYRLDEVLGPWKPYRDLLVSALMRTARRWGVTATEAEGEAYYHAVPSFGPHPDVPAGLAKVAGRIPLVILSNAADAQIQSNVDQLGVPFHAVYTAEMAQAYKPRMQAFEYMFDALGCRPEDVLHVSSSFRYDLMTAHDMKVGRRAFVRRGHDPALSRHYGAVEIEDIGGLAGLVGL